MNKRASLGNSVFFTCCSCDSDETLTFWRLGSLTLHFTKLDRLEDQLKGRRGCRSVALGIEAGDVQGIRLEMPYLCTWPGTASRGQEAAASQG